MDHVRSPIQTYLEANLEVNKIGKLLKEDNRFKMYFIDKNEKPKTRKRFEGEATGALIQLKQI